MDDIKEAEFSRHNSTDTHMSSETVAACTVHLLLSCWILLKHSFQALYIYTSHIGIYTFPAKKGIKKLNIHLP